MDVISIIRNDNLYAGGAIIMQTCPRDIYPLTPHRFYIVKLGFTGVLIFTYFALNIDCVEHNLCLEQNYKKMSKYIQLKIFIFTAVKNRCMLHGRVCVMNILGGFVVILFLSILFCSFQGFVHIKERTLYRCYKQLTNMKYRLQ